MVRVGDGNVLAKTLDRIGHERLDVGGEIRRNAHGQLVAALRDLGHAGVRQQQRVEPLVAGLDGVAATRVRAHHDGCFVLLHQALEVDGRFAGVVLVIERHHFEFHLFTGDFKAFFVELVNGELHPVQRVLAVLRRAAAQGAGIANLDDFLCKCRRRAEQAAHRQYAGYLVEFPSDDHGELL